MKSEDRDEQRPLVAVESLSVRFPVLAGSVVRRRTGEIRAVEGVSLKIPNGTTLGIVGESGSGKTTLGRAVLRLLKPVKGRILFRNRDVTDARGQALKELRREMSLVFQDPFSALNPRHTAKRIVAEPLRIHRLVPSENEVGHRVSRLFELVGLDPRSMNRFPHEFSGGQRQRIGIARALASDPTFIVCDEPVSALDVSIQAQIVNLLQDLQEELGLTYLFIAHDVSVVRHVSHEIAVMYMGRIVELIEPGCLSRAASHPYTRSLLSSVPIPDPDIERSRDRLTFRGDVSSVTPPFGCSCAHRCPWADSRCLAETPELEPTPQGGLVACHAVQERRLPFP